MAETGTPRGGAASIFDPELFVPTQGFMGCPNGYELGGCKLAVLGCRSIAAPIRCASGRARGPYAVSILALVGLVGKPRPPGAVGLPYRRESK